MNDGFAMDRLSSRTGGDSLMLALLVMLVGTGLAGLYSASYGYAMIHGKSASYFVVRQMLWLLPALVLFAMAAYIPLERLTALMGVIVVGSLALLLLPFIPGIGIRRNGASRWFGFGGYMFQPSELFKPVIILYLAYILSKKADRLGDVVNAVIPPLVVVSLGAFIILRQSDFSTAVLVVAIAVVMFWVSGVPLIFFGALATIVLPLSALSVLTSDYRLKRVLAFLSPGHDPSDLSYQVTGSMKAIRSGGLFGKGIGQGTLKIGSIPLVQSDFIFASWAEESGFVGVAAFFAVWVLFLWRGVSVALSAPDAFRRNLAFGVAAYLGLQMLVNVMVVSGSIPATGIPLPFFSSGGSSLMSVSIAAGFLYNVSRSSVSGGGAFDD